MRRVRQGGRGTGPGPPPRHGGRIEWPARGGGTGPPGPRAAPPSPPAAPPPRPRPRDPAVHGGGGREPACGSVHPLVVRRVDEMALVLVSQEVRIEVGQQADDGGGNRRPPQGPG